MSLPAVFAVALVGLLLSCSGALGQIQGESTAEDKLEIQTVESSPAGDTALHASDQHTGDSHVSPVQSPEKSGETKTDDGGGSIGSGERQPPFKYVGNTFSSKFHRPSCPFAKAINFHHLVFFEHRHDAIDRGFT